jgi:hypothetical protein
MKHPRPTPFQREVAGALGINISGDSANVAAARLADYLGPAIRDGRPPRPATESQRAYADSLGLDVSADTVSIASAKIAQHLFALNKQALRKLRLKPGDRVRQIVDADVAAGLPRHLHEFIVSSIQSNARVYFKGIGCQGAWSVHLEKVA